MRVVIIQDHEAKALVDKLELVKLRARVGTFAQTDSPEQQFKAVHEVFHYEVVKWLQEMGCKLT